MGMLFILREVFEILNNRLPGTCSRYFEATVRG